ncbi:hypothetical protein HanRHA438_Chr08g0339791 [Helianthus annuus]|nr:hypothetical protein HanRHA438_Chr08g0339791 [Helianthus annuus]
MLTPELPTTPPSHVNLRFRRPAAALGDDWQPPPPMISSVDRRSHRLSRRWRWWDFLVVPVMRSDDDQDRGDKSRRDRDRRELEEREEERRRRSGPAAHGGGHGNTSSPK